MAQIHRNEDTRTEEQKFNYRKMLALNMKDKICRAWKEAKKAKSRDAAKKAEEEQLKSKKIDEGIIDTTKEMTAENLTKMADKVLMAKELEVDSKSVSELTSKVSKSGSNNESENEKLIHENKQIFENHEKLKRTIEDSDERNGKTYKENVHLSGVLQEKERQINQELDEITNLKLQFQEANIENERINLKLNSYSSASFVLQHIVPKPIGKNKAGEDVYSDGMGVGYHQVPPPVLNNFSKKQSGLVSEDETNEKTNDVKLPEKIDVTFTSSYDEDSVQPEVVKNMVENVLKYDSDSTEDEECFLNNYIPKSKSQNNSNDEPTFVMYKMSGSDKLYSDIEFRIENVNVDKLTQVFKLVEINVSEIEGMKSSKRMLNFARDKSYYKKLVVPPRFNNNNQNRWSGGYQGGKNNQKKNFQNKKFVEKKVFVKSSSSISEHESESFSEINEEFF
ncbi:hypothetical protein Hanom_Chr14g01263801 [Helianthus anomalus]